MKKTRVRRFCLPRLSHSGIPGSMAVSASPGLIAAWPRPSSLGSPEASTTSPFVLLSWRLSKILKEQESREFPAFLPLKENFKNFFHSFKLLFILKREFLLSRVRLMNYTCAITMLICSTAIT